MEHKNHEFGISSWAVDNRITVYILTLIIVVMGTLAYINMPREDFPEILENKIFVSSIFPGNSSEDVEKLVIKPLEDQFKNISGVEKVTSSSFQDYGMIIVEFDQKITIEEAKVLIKDKVDQSKAKTDWPNLDNGSKVEPNVFNINISEEVPILNINLQGNYTTQQLKKFGEYLQDEIENVPEVKKVDILGVDDKEVEIAIDVFKMSAAQVSFDDIQNAVKYENMTLSGGNLVSQGSRNNIRIVGEISNPNQLNDVIVKSFGGTVYLKDIASVSFKEKEKTTYARESGQEVVMLNVETFGTKYDFGYRPSQRNCKNSSRKSIAKRFESQNDQRSIGYCRTPGKRIIEPYYLRNYSGYDCFDVYNGTQKFTFCWCGNSTFDVDGICYFISVWIYFKYDGFVWISNGIRTSGR